VESRVEEIRTAFADSANSPDVPCIPVIPVRMTEAWLLISEAALRASVDNRNGRVVLNLPTITTLEAIPNPKQLLEETLLMASELTGRRRKNSIFLLIVHESLILSITGIASSNCPLHVAL
jgi:hypothetical protein